MERLALLSGRSVTTVQRLAAVTEGGCIPLLNTVVIETGGEYAVLSYPQEGLTIVPPKPRRELQWPTEPELSMLRDGVEEWLDLTDLEDDEVLPPLPLTVRSINMWTVKGAYTAGVGISLSDGRSELVIMTTDVFDLVFVKRAVALKALNNLAEVLSMPVHHTSPSTH